MTALRVLPCARFCASLPAALIALAAVTGCSLGGPGRRIATGVAAGRLPVAGTAPSPTTPPFGSLVVVGRIVTMDEPPIAEALFIEDGTVVAVGSRGEVLAAAGDQVPVIDIGQTSRTPGSSTLTPTGSETASTTTWTRRPRPWTRPPAAVGPRSPSSGSTRSAWTSSSALAADDALPLRVDAYLALNFDREFLGDWYTDREPGPVDDHLRVEGLKIHLDDGWGHTINWEAAELTATIGRADEAGWQSRSTR